VDQVPRKINRVRLGVVRVLGPPRGQDYFEERYRQRALHNLAQRAKTLGMQLVPNENPV
jgi:hypothetical protein